VLAALDSERYFSMLDELDRLIDEPPFRPTAAEPAGDVLPREVRRAYRKTARRMDRAQAAAAGQARDVALHETRKAAKRARYAGEVAASALGTETRRFTRRVKKVQSVLGDHQDTVIARQAARELGIEAHLAGENAFTYGLLHEREAHDGESLQARARKTWRKASRSRNLNWMS
jgi:CHAD domain-containing protein